MKKWIISILIFVLLLFLINFNTIRRSDIGSKVEDLKENTVDKIKTTFERRQKITTETSSTQTQKELSLMSKCKADLKYYADISNKKFSVQISTLETIKADDRDSIDKFSDIWGYSKDIGSSKMAELFKYTYPLPEVDFPVVLFAVRFERKNVLYPTIIACNNEGEIMEYSKQQLLTTGQWLAGS